jgi:Ca2+-binding RTX toxin-like protein
MHRTTSPLVVVLLSVFSALTSAPASACPIVAACNAGGANNICRVNAGMYWNCDLARNGNTVAGTITTVYDPAGGTCSAAGNVCSWGADATGGNFCCELPVGGALSELQAIGGNYQDTIRFYDAASGLDAQGNAATPLKTIAFGLPGDDLIYGSRITAAAGTLLDEQLNGGTQQDTIFGGPGDDKIWGDAGNDVLHGDDNNDTIDGGDNDDSITGDNHDDTITGGLGSDKIRGMVGYDTLSGGAGNDFISGGSEDDIINGDDNNDILCGDGGADAINGGIGNNVLWGNSLVGDYLTTVLGADQCDNQSPNDGFCAGFFAAATRPALCPPP